MALSASVVLPLCLQDYEEVIIPVVQQAAPVSGERRVEISEFDAFARPVFDGYQSLNRVQSLVFDVAYKSNENMLVCAPTGAGKTDIAMMTVLRTLRQYLDDDTLRLRKDDFKIIYVAPMKALASEVVGKFSKRLKSLDLRVQELTGDMQMTKNEIMKTQMIVTTPEKWDVITRKGTGDVALVQKVKLLIIDEVHLLHDERGSVIESLVARTLRQVEATQSLIRIVGLSATLPNYVDVAQFLRVNPMVGMFYFDNGFRPVPLGQQFIGVKGAHMKQVLKMNQVCYEKTVHMVRQGHQVMVFVHSRRDTVKTAQTQRELARDKNESELFRSKDPRFQYWLQMVHKSQNKELKELFSHGFAMHHAGMSVMLAIIVDVPNTFEVC